MPQRIRIADRFMKQSAEQLVATAGAIITGFTNNPAFPAPPVDFKAVQAAADDINAASAAQVHGGTAATAEKKNKQEALISILRKLKRLHFPDNGLQCKDDCFRHKEDLLCDKDNLQRQANTILKAFRAATVRSCQKFKRRRFFRLQVVENKRPQFRKNLFFDSS